MRCPCFAGYAGEICLDFTAPAIGFRETVKTIYTSSVSRFYLEPNEFSTVSVLVSLNA
jgi:hypothetical protein